MAIRFGSSDPKIWLRFLYVPAHDEQIQKKARANARANYIIEIEITNLHLHAA